MVATSLHLWTTTVKPRKSNRNRLKALVAADSPGRVSTSGRCSMDMFCSEDESSSDGDLLMLQQQECPQATPTKTPTTYGLLPPPFALVHLPTAAGFGVMDLCVTIKGVSFLLQTSMGIFGNVVVLLAYANIIYTEPKLLPVDMILCHLAFVNLILLLVRSIPQTMTVFGMTDLLNDSGCKVVIYAYRISRALSICLTCMLSVFQAVTIAPAGPRLSRLKTALPSLLCPISVGMWLLNMAICIATPLFSTAPRNGTLPAFTLNLGFCHVDFRDNLSYVINGVVFSVRDFGFVALMVGSSGYILLLLHRHSLLVRGMRRSHGGGAETRAAKTVITLVVLYVVFFGIDNTIWIYMLTVAKVSPVVVDMKVFFTSCFASLSPYFIISSNKKVKAKIVCAAVQDQPSVDNQGSSDK